MLTLLILAMMFIFIGVQIALAIYYNPHRVIARWEKKDAERSRLNHLKKKP